MQPTTPNRPILPDREAANVALRRGPNRTASQRAWLNRLRFPAELEAGFQQDYFERSRNTVRAGSALAAMLMVPTALYNVAVGFREAAVIDAALAIVVMALFALVSRPGGALVWKRFTFAVAAAAALALGMRNAVFLPHRPGITATHAGTLTLVADLQLIIYAFVIGRFTLRWYLAFVVFDLAVSAVATAIWFPSGLAPVAFESTGSLLPAVAMLGLLAYRQELAARGEFLANHLLAEEHERAERLLLNVLPPSVAARLKDQPGTIADDFSEVGILFADIVGFTPLAASMPAADVVRMLNDVFTAFDTLADQYGMEKIKTIGDAYMAAVGLPEPRADHAVALADMALAMRTTVASFRRADDGEPLEIRIGINTGPVVAGVIGTRKFIYDLWGDTVNVASRLESQGAPGMIQCTEAAYALLRERYTFAGPRVIVVKGRGEMPVWELVGRA